MKKTILIAIIGSTLSAATFTSCKSLRNAAVKHWSKKQMKKFLSKCEDGVISKFGDKASDVCGCATKVAEEKYPNIDDAMEMKTLEIIKLAIDCK